MYCRLVGVTGGFRLNCSKYAIGDAEQQLGVGQNPRKKKKSVKVVGAVGARLHLQVLVTRKR